MKNFNASNHTTTAPGDTTVIYLQQATGSFLCLKFPNIEGIIVSYLYFYRWLIFL